MDDQNMFSDLQAMDGTSAILSAQSIDTGPLFTGNTGRNVGQGTPLHVVIFGRVVTGTLTGSLTVSFLTDGDDQLGSPTRLLTKAALVIPTTTGSRGKIWTFQFPEYENYERYIGLEYTPSVDWNNNLLITAGVVLMPSQLRAYANAANLI